MILCPILKPPVHFKTPVLFSFVLLFISYVTSFLFSSTLSFTTLNMPETLAFKHTFPVTLKVTGKPLYLPPKGDRY